MQLCRILLNREGDVNNCAVKLWHGKTDYIKHRGLNDLSETEDVTERVKVHHSHLTPKTKASSVALSLGSRQEASVPLQDVFKLLYGSLEGKNAFLLYSSDITISGLFTFMHLADTFIQSDLQLYMV